MQSVTKYDYCQACHLLKSLCKCEEVLKVAQPAKPAPAKKKKKTDLEIVPDQKTDFEGWLCWKLGVSREQLEKMRAAIPEHTATAIGLREPVKKDPERIILQAKSIKETDREKLATDREEIRRANARKAAENRERWLNELKSK